jgi:hypothetical protein
MSRGPSLNAQDAPAVAPVEGMNTEVGGDRGMDGAFLVPNVPRTRTQAQLPNGAVMLENGAEGRERAMPRASVVR